MSAYRDSPVFPTGHPMPRRVAYLAGNLSDEDIVALNAHPGAGAITEFYPPCRCASVVCEHEPKAKNWIDQDGRRDWVGRGE